VPPELKSVVATLGVMYAAAEASIGANPGKRRELDDTAKKLGVLLWKANAGEVSPEVGSKLQQVGLGVGFCVRICLCITS
jgi:protein transport protein SEC31